MFILSRVTFARSVPRAAMKKAAPYRRARACPSPCNDRGGQAPALRVSRPFPLTVGRGPVPRRATIAKETALVCVRFSRGSGDRGGQAPALRLSRPSPLHRRAWALGCHTRIREGFPRRASIAGEPALVCVRFSRRSNDRGGQAPALR